MLIKLNGVLTSDFREATICQLVLFNARFNMSTFGFLRFSSSVSRRTFTPKFIERNTRNTQLALVMQRSFEQRQDVALVISSTS